LPPYLFAAAAAVAFAFAVFLLLHDRKGAASILGAMALVAALLAYLPQLDSLSAFAVNVKLRNSLDRADEILAKLRDLSIVNAKFAYTILAWGNRLGTPRAIEKQRLLDEMDEQLSEMKVSNDERAELKRNYVRFIAFDFYQMYAGAIDYALNRGMEAAQAKVQSESTDANKTVAQQFSVRMNDWRLKRARPSLEQMPVDGFRKLLHDNMPLDTFSTEQTQQLTKIADQIADLFEASRQKGGYTKEAAEFYDKYNDGLGAALYKLFR
jgi:hypothetical protein